MHPRTSVSTTVESQAGHPWAVASADEAARIARQIAWLLAGSLTLAAAVLCWRRLAGAFDLPLELPFLAAAGGLSVLLAMGARIAARWGADMQNPTTGQYVLSWLVSCSLVAWAASLTMPGVSWGGILLLYALVAVEEGCSLWFQKSRWGHLLRGGLDVRTQRPGACFGPLSERAFDPRSQLPEKLGVAAGGAMPSGDVVQELLRLQGDDGTQWLRGRLRTRLTPGQRTVSIHAAFCPPFSRTPNISFDQSEGPTSRVTVAQVLPYGVRFDIRLAEPTEEMVSLGLHFAAQVPGGQELHGDLDRMPCEAT